LSITVQWYTKEEQPFASATWQMMLGAASSIVSQLPGSISSDFERFLGGFGPFPPENPGSCAPDPPYVARKWP
jgi:hypothetical protein